MLPEYWQKARNILAVRLDNIGDVVLLSAALRTIKEHLPAARITLMASPAGSQVAPLLPWVDDVIVHAPVWQDISGTRVFTIDSQREMIETLRARSFDVAAIFTSFPQSPHPPAYACFLAGIPVRIGQSKEFGGALLTRWLRPLPDYLHQADRDLFLLESEGFSVTNRHLELHVPSADQENADALLREVGIDPEQPFIFLAPGASCESRRYDAARFGEALALLNRAVALPVVLAGSPRERALEAQVLASGGKAASLIGRTTLAETAAVIRRSSLVIANNSGSLHIADAFNVPMVILYSGTEIQEQWKPRKAQARLLYRQTRCAPCYLFACPGRRECLEIGPDEIVREAEGLLSCGQRNRTVTIAGKGANYAAASGFSR